MTKKLTLSISDKLHEELAEYRNIINISNVCSEALKREIDKIDSLILEGKKRFGVLSSHEKFKLSYENGMYWAGYEADLLDLAIVCNWTYEWVSNDPIAQQTIDLLEENNIAIKKTMLGYSNGYDFIFTNEFISKELVTYPVDYNDVDIVEVAVAFSQGASTVWDRLKNRLIPILIASDQQQED